MGERGTLRIAAGMEVYDRDGHKLGTVARLHELDAPDAPPAGARAADPDPPGPRPRR